MIIVAQLQGRPLPTRLRLDKGFQPCPVETGRIFVIGLFRRKPTRSFTTSLLETTRAYFVCVIPPQGHSRSTDWKATTHNILILY
jgi:hypothetical protein